MTAPHARNSAPTRACGAIPAPQTQDLLWGWGTSEGRIKCRGPSAGNAPAECPTPFPARRPHAPRASWAPKEPVGQGPESVFRSLFPAGSSGERYASCPERRASVPQLPSPGLSAARAAAVVPRGPGSPGYARGLQGRDLPSEAGRALPPADLQHLDTGVPVSHGRERLLPPQARRAAGHGLAATLPAPGVARSRSPRPLHQGQPAVLGSHADEG